MDNEKLAESELEQKLVVNEPKLSEDSDSERVDTTAPTDSPTTTVNSSDQSQTVASKPYGRSARTGKKLEVTK